MTSQGHFIVRGGKSHGKQSKRKFQKVGENKKNFVVLKKPNGTQTFIQMYKKILFRGKEG